MNYLPNRPININPNKFYTKITTLFVGLVMKAFLKFGCRNVYLLNQERLLNLVENRSKNQAILTVQNHASTLEDPLLWGMLPTRILGNPDKMRWSLAAREILFTSELKSKFFEYGHIIPVNRGDGVYQESITKAIEVINRGG
jgi:monolysocardiolipin acyltransferase